MRREKAGRQKTGVRSQESEVGQKGIRTEMVYGTRYKAQGPGHMAQGNRKENEELGLVVLRPLYLVLISSVPKIAQHPNSKFKLEI